MEEDRDQRLATVLMVAVAAAALLLVLYLAAASTFRSIPLWDEKTIELGESLEEDPSFYIDGPEWTMSHATVDLTGVDLAKTGNYKVSVRAPFDTREFLIKIRDTTAPGILTADTSNMALAVGKTYDLSILGVSVNDISGTADLHYLHDGSEIEDLFFEDPGIKEIVIRSTDASHNRTEKKIRLLLDTPPVLYGLHDQYVQRGSNADDLDPVFAEDDMDGWLSDQVVSDTYDVDFDTPGDYEAEYSVVDSCGLETAGFLTVHVVTSPSEAALHERDWPVDDDEMEDVCSGGYFGYEPSEKDDRQWVADHCDRCLVNLYYEDREASSSGSAFIYRITPEYVYFVSAYHVTQFLDDRPVKVTFFDDTSLYYNMDSIRLSAGNEASLFRIPLRRIPYHTLMKLKEVYWDDNIYNELKTGDTLLEYSANFKGGLTGRLIKDVQIISFTLSDIQKRYVDEGEYFCATRRSISGMSGTAVFDLKGRLAGICSKTIYPLENEDEVFREGCDLILKVDHISELMKRADELDD